MRQRDSARSTLTVRCRAHQAHDADEARARPRQGRCRCRSLRDRVVSQRVCRPEGGLLQKGRATHARKTIIVCSSSLLPSRITAKDTGRRPLPGASTSPIPSGVATEVMVQCGRSERCLVPGRCSNLPVACPHAAAAGEREGEGGSQLSLCHRMLLWSDLRQWHLGSEHRQGTWTSGTGARDSVFVLLVSPRPRNIVDGTRR